MIVGYPRHSDKLPGPLFKTDGTQPWLRASLYLLGFKIYFTLC